MHFSSTFYITALTAATSATATALPAPQAPSSPEKKFGLVAINSGSDVQYAGFSAAKSSLLLGLPQGDQNATCDVQDSGDATFYLNNGGLFLYSTSATPQQFYVDRSGMGQGKIGFTTGAQPAPKNAERTGWVFDGQNHLQFDGNDLLACPNSIDGSHSVWIPAGVQNPGGNENCIGVAARVVDTQNPVSCQYTQ